MQLFAKKYYGFSPLDFPVISFSETGSRDALLAKARSGDRIVFVAVEGEDAVPEERGRILGMAEIGRAKVRTLDLVKDPSKILAKHRKPNGDLIWPEGIPMLRAWKFISPPHRLELLKKAVIDGQATRKHAVLLSEQDRVSILALPHEEIGLPEVAALDNARLYSSAMSGDFDRVWKIEAARMAKTALETAANSNGQEVVRTIKNKNADLSEGELQVEIRKLLIQQQYRCAITGKQLELSPEKHWFAASLDRIDSNGHYALGNLQIVTKAANRAKSDITPDCVSDFFDALQREPV